MTNANPINGVRFGHEKTRADCLARAAWDYEQAAKLRAARKPVGYEALVEGHERTARDYERLAKNRPGAPAPAHATRVRTTRDEYVVQGNYGYGDGWEDLTAEATRKEALDRLREYRENERGVPFRLKKRRAKIVAAPMHAKRRSHATKIDRAAQLVDRYRPWTPSYSNEAFDRAQSLASALTQIDREEHDRAFGSAPPAGYSKLRYEQAKRVVDEARRGAYRQATSAHARKKKLTSHEAKKLLQSEGVDFTRDYHASASMSQGNRIAEVAKMAGYRKQKSAPGSTARMYFQYLARLK